ncbi:putative transcription factor WD40-like family [Helianthus annuus]|uniref:Putative WD40/YVTN repeat-like-containing domain-containing protein n=2 Tax=Helianthus annuus TaxID=4232 RepID=A0A251UAE9_HELAN|nr:putative WD40-repeat-containing domain superfamily [Helianthus annuus]KAJ0549910.1 putative transcription factor WD40-like family [Helianthus annuus]KAJ0556465.1 putative transcription factor WD40-like family [Helianthus annuus]KAJ0562871.1 putative transcription factor WD40-like family [Helianthus annuus]KAJ0731009.1 putative transcription factor WD40-like family [Helianthus annuus]
MMILKTEQMFGEVGEKWPDIILEEDGSKESCQLRFRGHNARVTVLFDKLLGNENGKAFSSQGEDNTVCLWSLKSTGKRGQHALKATVYGHEKPMVFMSITR